jgi:Activator of Hsp90 ATPase homolog 1-like protein
MKQIKVSVQVPYPRVQVYEFLAVSANHEAFNRHMLSDWSFDGPPSGIGSKTHATATLGGRRDPVDIEVIDDVPPSRIVERNAGAGGERVATGTYSLAEHGAETTVTFEYAWQRVPLAERIAGPLVRRVMRGALETSMRELASTLDAAFTKVDG